MSRCIPHKHFPNSQIFDLKKTGKLVQDSKKGIDWYRYYKVILQGKLLPFAKECQKERPNTIVQEDNASPMLIITNFESTTSGRFTDVIATKLSRFERY